MSIPQQAQQAAPQQAEAPVQTNEEAIGSFARGFLADLESHPDADEPRSNEVEEAPQVEAETPESEPEAETPPQPEIPLVEVDIDGEKFQIPEKVKHRVMADKDYRQKTMELSASRKQLETLTATAAQVAQQAQQLAPYYAQLHQMDSRAQYLQQAMQQARANQDPLAFNEAQGELGILLHQRTQFANGLQGEVSRLTAAQQEIRLKQLQADLPALVQEVPEITKPETRQKLASYASEQGLPQEALDYLNYSAVGTKLLWKAQQFDAMKAQSESAKKTLQEKTKTLPAATPSSRVPDKGAQSKQLSEQWQKRGGKINDPAFDQLLKAKLRGR